MTLFTLAALAAPDDAPPRPAKLSLDRATAAELDALADVEPDHATAIVALRDERGGLTSVEELRILGLSEATLDSLRRSTVKDVVVPKPPDAPFSSPQEVLAQFVNEPSIGQVQSWATSYAGASPDRVRRWLTQSATFAALPQLTLEYDFQDDFDQGFLYFDQEGVQGLVPGTPTEPVVQDADKGQTLELGVRLVWDLDKLVMSSEKIRVIQEAQDITKLRDDVLTNVTRVYFDRRRLQVEQLLVPEVDPLAQVKEQLRLMELTANLDALTGGAFSAGVPR